MKTLVVIVAYNFERWLTPCLDSLRQSAKKADVVVIDNASTDHTVQRIEAEYPEVRLVKSKENLGFGKANNVGMAIALREGYDFAFLLNQDAWVAPDAIGRMEQTAAAHPEYGIISPVHLDGTGLALDDGFAAYTGFSTLHELRGRERADVFDAAFVNAAFWLIPRQVLERVGGFSPMFFLYGEDVDLANRIKHFGYKIGVCPAATACHDRAKRVVTPQAQARAITVFLLSCYTDIRRSLPMALAFSVGACVKWMGVYGCKGNRFLVKTYWETFTMLLRKTPRILKVRRETKAEGPHFL